MFLSNVYLKCCFYFISSLIKNFLVETVPSSYYLKLSPPLLLSV